MSKDFSEPLKSFLAEFEPCNPLKPLQDLSLDESQFSSKKFKLVYASLGTIFNQGMNVYEIIINAINELNQNNENEFKIKLLISCGDKMLLELKEIIERRNLNDRILIMNTVSQIDVLKRANLFITHSGMNSTSESIHYGVPMVCIPLAADQPLVAYRCCDELGLGIRLQMKTLRVQQLSLAINRILNDKSYLERVTLFSMLSRKYNGHVNSANLIINYLQEKRKKLT